MQEKGDFFSRGLIGNRTLSHSTFIQKSAFFIQSVSYRFLLFRSDLSGPILDTRESMQTVSAIATVKPTLPMPWHKSTRSLEKGGSVPEFPIHANQDLSLHFFFCFLCLYYAKYIDNTFSIDIWVTFYISTVLSLCLGFSFILLFCPIRQWVLIQATKPTWNQLHEFAKGLVIW
jgi:hypothetical protein